MQLRQLIQPGITASVLAHVLVLGLLVLFSEVHPFGTVTAEPIAVDLVTPDELAKRPDEKKPEEDKPQQQVPKEESTAPTQQAASSPPPPAAEPVEQQQPAARLDRREVATAAQPQPAQPEPSTPPASKPSPKMPPARQQQPAYTPPEPDLTVKYNVMLGLPEALPPLASSSGDKPGDGIDANVSSAANISSSLVAKFREHLKTCSKLPATVARSDNVFVKLRVMMTPKARLAAEPVLIEGTASMEGLELKKSAIEALSACQPYDMLPVDRYGEWKVLDLPFRPQDFG